MKGADLQIEVPSVASIPAQLERLAALGVPALAGLSDDKFLALGAELTDVSGGLVVVNPSFISPRLLAPFLTHKGKPGFVVVDMTDIDEFQPIEGVSIPTEPLHVIHGLDRGDDLRNWSPNEALPEITGRGRRPLTVSEGISWLLQQPEVLEPNYCFMTIASRKRKLKGLDSRTPALWISSGTGRDGAANRQAPKVGWCWAGNRHTWLGFASTALHPDDDTLGNLS